MPLADKLRGFLVGILAVQNDMTLQGEKTAKAAKPGRKEVIQIRDEETARKLRALSKLTGETPAEILVRLVDENLSPEKP